VAGYLTVLAVVAFWGGYRIFDRLRDSLAEEV